MLPLGSQAKAWTAMNVMRLVEKGELSLDAYLPELVDEFLWTSN